MDEGDSTMHLPAVARSVETGQFAHVSRNTRMASGRTVSWLLDLRARSQRDQPFLVWEPFDGERDTYSYARFDQVVSEVAGGLRARGISKGDTVIVHLENCPEFLLSWFALTRLGAIAVCTNARSSVDELRYYGEHSQAVAAITQPKFADDVAEALPGLKWVAVTESDGGD